MQAYCLGDGPLRYNESALVKIESDVAGKIIVAARNSRRFQGRWLLCICSLGSGICDDVGESSRLPTG